MTDFVDCAQRANLKASCIGAERNEIVAKGVTPATDCEAGFWVKSTDNLGKKTIAAFIVPSR